MNRPVVHASLTQPMVDRLIAVTAEVHRLAWWQARDVLYNRWVEEGRRCTAAGLSTWRMWKEMASMAQQAVEPRGWA